MGLRREREDEGDFGKGEGSVGLYMLELAFVNGGIFIYIDSMRLGERVVDFPLS